MRGHSVIGGAAWLGALCLLATGAAASATDFDGLYPLANAGFERRDSDAWVTTGAVARASGAYRGRRSLELAGPGPAVAMQRISLGAAGPLPGQAVALGAWVRLSPGDAEEATGSAGDVDRLELLLHAVAPDGTRVTLARVVRELGQLSPGRWVYLEAGADGAARVPAACEALVLSVGKSGGASVQVDCVQAGRPAAVTGNPPRLATLNFLGRYRSPLFAGSTTPLTDPRQIWRNWCWIEPPACAPSETSFFHNPDCATSATCLRANGRRDAAVSVEEGPDELPLFGAYDSRDPELLRAQLDLAEAIGFDSVLYLHQGHALALQSVAQGLEPLNEQCFEALLDEAERPGRTLKVAVMIEPKVHLLGWVAGQPTKADKLAGIEDDLVHLLATYAGRTGYLRHDGRPVVYIFRNDICDPTGTQCLNEADWQALALAAFARTGEQPFLVADVPPPAGGAGPSPFGGLSRWQLVALAFMKYRTFAAVQAGLPSHPAPVLASVAAHADQVNAVAVSWRDQVPAGRIAVALAWPGFDDSGVGGWASGNFSGEDGQPLCIRVADGFGGGFYGATVSSAVASSADWLQVATWNDWNEGTQIEPRWRASYVQDVLAGKLPKRPVFRDVFARAIETQQALAAFKGTTYKPGKQVRLHRVAVRYLRRAATDPTVAQYD